MDQHQPQHDVDAALSDIIIVDDVPAHLRLLATMLTKNGYRTRAFTSGEEAFAAMQAAPPDIIVLDVNMPEMSGYELCSRIKTHERLHDIPVVFISARDEARDKVRAFEAGGVDYITKPFQVREVLARLDTHLTMRRLQRQLQQAQHELQVANQHLQTANTGLEQQVAERTAELARANTELVQLNMVYERFVPRELISLLNKQTIIDTHLGDQVQRDMTVMFVDIRDFTSLSEHMTPQENFNFINGYFQQVGPTIRQHSGFIDKYIGDAIMALFPRGVDDALHAALAVQQATVRYNQTLAHWQMPPVTIGIGIHTGSLMLGILGEEHRLQGTVISDAVNATARLEALTKLYGAPIIISEQVFRALHHPHAYVVRSLGQVQVKGKHLPLSILEVLDGELPDVRARKLHTRSAFETGLAHVFANRPRQALHCFEQVLALSPDDRAALLHYNQVARTLNLPERPVPAVGVDSL